MLLPIHVLAGGLAIVLGAVALLVKKGGVNHRRAGLLFVYAMVVMGITAAMLGFRNSPTDSNVFGGLMTVYLVVTALTTVRPVTDWTRRINLAMLPIPLAVAGVDYFLGAKALSSPGRTYHGVPFAMFFFLATVLLLAAVGDIRIMLSGLPRGAARLSRHLWRMCFALFIAAGSFFSIRARVEKILPWPFTTLPMRMAAILLVFVAMFYWLWRVRRRRTLPVIVRHDVLPAAPAN